ncbi:MAG: AAA family ATPase [Gammaproteobacteria bacterium]|nr:AAA family ATPase [Gammaproteobacteria bacterium]
MLSQEHVTATQLLPVHLKNAEYASSNSYKAGMVVRFNEHYSSINVAKEDYLKVVESFDRTNQVILETGSGKKIVWNPNKAGGRKQRAIELYHEAVNTIHLGEKIKMSRSLKYKGLVSGDLITVTGFKDNKIIALTDKGKSVSLDLFSREEQHYAYSYCDTAYASLPQNTDVILTYHAGNASPYSTNMLRSLMTHNDKKVWCYTLNQEKLLCEMQKTSPEARYALDYVIDKKNENNYVASVQQALIEGIQNNFSEQNTETIASEAIVYAMKHLSEREAAFNQNELLSVAIKNVLGSAAPNELHDALRRAETSGYLIPGVVSRDGKLWTTKDALQEEHALLSMAKKGVGQLVPISTPERVQDYLAQTHLSVEQKEAITTLCTNTNRVIPIQGLAGVGKTTMMKAFVDVCEQNNHEMVLLAPTHTAAKELRANGLSAQTLDAFLKSSASNNSVETISDRSTAVHSTSNKNYPIYILDEATMASTKRQYQLAKIVEAQGGKFIPVGDVFQFSSIEAGKTHENLQSIGIEVIKMTDIQRQRDNPELLSAVRSTYELNYEDAFARLGPRIIESGEEIVGERTLDNPEQRLALMADEFIKLTPEERQHMLMITLSNAERSLLNNKIRQGLIEKNELGEKSAFTAILKSKDMTQVELTRASNYAVNDVVLVGVSQTDLGIKKGEYLTVIDQHLQKNTLTLQRTNGEKVMLQLPSSRNKTPLALSVYQKEQRDLRVGDWIRWTKSNPTLGLLSPEYALVTNVEGNNALCQPMTFTKEGAVIESTIISISPEDARYFHWDYAYAVTNYASQGRSIQSVRASYPSEHPQLTTQRAFLVTETRAITDIKIYTDNKTKLLNHLLKTPGDKKSALEAIGKLKPMDKKTVIKKEKADLLTKKTSAKKSATHAQYQQQTPMIDSQKLREAMNDQAENIVLSLLGEPKERQGNTLRFGKHKGSLVVTIKGQKQGLWHDFQTGEGGDMLRLFAQQKGLSNAQDYSQLLSEASRYLGVDLSKNVGSSRFCVE